MAISERRRLTFTVIAVILLAILTWLLIYGMLLLPPRQYLSSTTTPEPIQPQSTNEVTIWGNDFYPSAIIVPVGTTVTWTNLDSQVEYHTVYSDSSLNFKSRRVFLNGTFSYTFTRPGAFNYICDLHDMMEGTVIVE